MDELDPVVCIFFADGTTYWEDADGMLLRFVTQEAQAWKDARGGGEIVGHSVTRMSRVNRNNIPAGHRGPKITARLAARAGGPA